MPRDEMRIWKLTDVGAVEGVISPGALFVGDIRRPRESGEVDLEHPLPTYELADGQRKRGAQQGRQANRNQKKEKASSQPVQSDLMVHDNLHRASILKETLTRREGPRSLRCDIMEPIYDRFGHSVANGSDSLRPGLEKPPEDLTPFAWGWGGEFRLGTGRDGAECWPRNVICTNFKVSRF